MSQTRARTGSWPRRLVALMALLAVNVVGTTTVERASAADDDAKSCSELRGWQLPGQPACLYNADIALRAGGYILRVEDAATPHYEAFYNDALTVAEQLTFATGLPFRVGDSVPRDQAPAPGEIILRPDSYFDECGGIACAGGTSSTSWPWIGERDRIEGGQIWFRPDIHSKSNKVRLLVIRHEVAHVLGLHHWDLVESQRSINGTKVTSQVMQWNVRSTDIRDYQSGDIAGLQYLANVQRRSPSATVTRLGTVPGGFVVNGTGTDPSNKAAPLTLRVTIDRDAGRDTQFGKAVSTTAGTHKVCVTFVNVGAGVDVDGGCQTVTIPAVAKQPIRRTETGPMTPATLTPATLTLATLQSALVSGAAATS